MRKHEMMFEGKGSRKRKAVKTTKKGSVVVRKLNSWKRQAWNLLGAVGCLAVAWWLIQMAMGGG